MSPAISYKSKKSRPKSGPAEFRHLAFNLAYCRARREHAAATPDQLARTRLPETDDERDARRPALQICLLSFGLEENGHFLFAIFGLVVTGRRPSRRRFGVGVLNRHPIGP